MPKPVNTIDRTKNIPLPIVPIPGIPSITRENNFSSPGNITTFNAIPAQLTQPQPIEDLAQNISTHLPTTVDPPKAEPLTDPTPTVQQESQVDQSNLGWYHAANDGMFGGSSSDEDVSSLDEYSNITTQDVAHSCNFHPEKPSDISTHVHIHEVTDHSVTSNNNKPQEASDDQYESDASDSEQNTYNVLNSLQNITSITTPQAIKPVNKKKIIKNPLLPTFHTYQSICQDIVDSENNDQEFKEKEIS
jgi:hypothetical protein